MNCMSNRENTHDVDIFPDEKITKRSEPNKPSTNQDKHRERSSNFCYTLNPWEHISLNIKSHEIFFKKHLLVETFSSDELIAKAGIRGCFLRNLFWKFHKFSRRTFPEVSGNLQLCLKKQFHPDVFLGNLRNFSNSYSQKLHILLCFFITYFANFIYLSPNLWN